MGSGRVGPETRANARDRRQDRRQLLDRRSAGAATHTPERREATDRRTGERRIPDPPDQYSREDTHRIGQLVLDAEARARLQKGLKYRCPQCNGHLVLTPPIRWSGGIRVWVIRCSVCPRQAVISQRGK